MPWVVALAAILVLSSAVLALAIVVLVRTLRAPRGATVAPPAAVATPTQTPAEHVAPGATTSAAPRVKKPVVDSLEVTTPDHLPRFSDIGGMDAIKEELRATVALLIDRSGIADAYHIEWNGVLLHGPPGVGKTLLARATAGEMGLNFIYVSTADAVSKWIGEAPGKVDHAFVFAKRNTPCVLFFDEFDSLASDRSDDHHLEYRRLTNQLLASLEEYRETAGLVVMAATNAYEQLDPAVIRPGRFDRHIAIGLPDLAARAAILAVHLRDRPLANDVDVDELALLAEGCSAATLEAAVEGAAVATAADATKLGQVIPMTQRSLVAHLETLLDTP